MLLPVLQGRAQKAVFCADLIPGAAWMHLPITMGYDRFPEALVDEKEQLYKSLEPTAWYLFTHDPSLAAARVERDEKGRYRSRDGVAHFDCDLDQN